MTIDNHAFPCLQALTFVGPTRDNPEPDPLAIIHLDDRYECYLSTCMVLGVSKIYIFA